MDAARVSSASPGRVREIGTAFPQICELDVDVQVGVLSGPSSKDVDVDTHAAVLVQGFEKTIDCQRPYTYVACLCVSSPP